LEEPKFEQLPDLRGASTYHVGANLATGDCVVLNHLDELKVQVCFVVWEMWLVGEMSFEKVVVVPLNHLGVELQNLGA